jgi:hypothetical protein
MTEQQEPLARGDSVRILDDRAEPDGKIVHVDKDGPPTLYYVTTEMFGSAGGWFRRDEIEPIITAEDTGT